MKSKPNIGLISCFALLVFSLSFLVTHLLKHHLYIDAAFSLAVPALFGLMVFFYVRDCRRKK